MLKRNLRSWTFSQRLLAASAWALTISACSLGKPDIAEVPAHPTFEVDVKPLLADHCLLCHGYPAKRGAPSDFRLDVFDPLDGVPGAKAEGEDFIDAIDEDEMPPAAKWGDGVGPNGRAMLHNWQKDQYPP